MFPGDWLEDIVLGGVLLDGAVTPDDWPELMVHEMFGVLSADDVRFDTAAMLTSDLLEADMLVSNVAIVIWRCFKEKNCISKYFMQQLLYNNKVIQLEPDPK